MMFSKTELEMLSEIGKGIVSVSELAKALKISISQMYRLAQKLNQKGVLQYSKNTLYLERKTHINMLLLLLSKAKNLSEPFSGTGLQIYSSIITPKKVSEIEKETGLHKTTVLKKLNQGRKMSLILKEKRKYRVNEKIWPDAKELLIEVKKFEESLDNRVPVSSVIYFKNENEIVFSTKVNVDAEKTAFSAYDKYGLGLLLVNNYYFLPKRNLTKKEVFVHSLLIAEKEPETRYLIMIALFYAKYKNELLDVKHPVIENIINILSGKIIFGYPTLAEIQDRASIYHLKV